MQTTTPAQLEAALLWRYATKQFDPTRSIPADTWATLEQALLLAPSSFGLQPWKFLVVENKHTREQLRAESWNQPQVTDASHYVVLAGRSDLSRADIDSWITRLAEVNATPEDNLAQLKGMITGFAETLSHEARAQWNARQVYIALGQLLTAAALLGIDSCPMEGISRDAYDRLLSLENTGYTTLVACALGYRAETDKYGKAPKARFPKEKVFQVI